MKPPQGFCILQNLWLLVQLDAAAGRHTTALFSCPSLSDAVGSLRGFVAPEASSNLTSQVTCDACVTTLSAPEVIIAAHS